MPKFLVCVKDFISPHTYLRLHKKIPIVHNIHINAKVKIEAFLKE